MYTFACNLRCDYCWLWGETGVAHNDHIRKMHAEQLSVNVLMDLLEQASKYELRHVNLSGGEPLVSKTWYPLAKRAQELGLSIELTTSGVLVERNLSKILEVFNQVNVSLNCPPGTAAKLRGGPKGNYDKTIQGMKAITAFRQANPGKGPRLCTLTTISDTNYTQMGELTRYLRDEGILIDQMYFQFLIFIPPEEMEAMNKILREDYDADLELLPAYRYAPSGIDFDVMAAQVKEIREAFPAVRFSAPLDREGMEQYYRGNKWGVMPKFCATPWTELDVLPNGDIYTCPDVVVGNILEQRFEEIWNGQALKQLRKRVSKQHFPVCTGCFHYWGDRGAHMNGGG